MSVDVFEEVKSIFYTSLLYLTAFFSLMSPGTVIWRLFGHRKGKVRLFARDLICDSDTLMRLEKCSKPLDQFTNALCPFVPLFLIDSVDQWKSRRDVFTFGNNRVNARLAKISLDAKLPPIKGNILWPLFESVFRLSFRLVFLRHPTEAEFNDMFPGLLDINKLLKRFTSSPNHKERQKFFDRTLALIEQNDADFLFHDCPDFFQLKPLDQVSAVAEDFITTISVQCTDLLCHLLVVQAEHAEAFHTNLDNCVNETLRLYPLTDLWVRQPTTNGRGWIASLTQLNRNGWANPDEFLPERWNTKDHPPLLSWGFDSRRCPAQKMGTNIATLFFEEIIHADGFWSVPARNFAHERTFPYGCQLWVGYGEQPVDAAHWMYPNKLRMQLRRWSCEKLRMFDQNELN